VIDYEQLQIVKSLILPPGLFVLATLLGLGLRRRLVGKLLLFSALASLYLLSTPFVAGELMSSLKLSPALKADSVQTDVADAIVVLGGAVYLDAPEYGGDTIGGAMLERIRYTAWLHHRTNLPVIITGSNTEAEAAAKALKQEFWVDSILALENHSRTTWDNAVNTKAVLERFNISKIILVTSAWHMPRAIDSFNRVGIYPMPAPTAFSPTQLPPNKLSSWLPTITSLNDSHWALHEHIGNVWYHTREIITHLPDGTPPRSPAADVANPSAEVQPAAAGAAPSSAAEESTPTTGVVPESTEENR
jgi:uncharacterized SAM-binding protein YcdF (DUF218 family)